MRKIQIIVGALLVTVLLVLGACALPAPAEFEVESLNINPPEVKAGETVSITAVVKNIGGSEGTYAMILTVDGVSVETEEVALMPGSSKEVTFSLVKDTAGTYEIRIGELSSSLTVKEKLVVREVELKYDDGTAEDALSYWSGGHIVDFSPPATPFTIKKIRIAGLLAGEGTESLNFDLQILDKDLKVLYSATYPYSKFTRNATTWIEFELPDTKVADKFYVHVYTLSPRFGLHIGADNSVPNEHSNVTVRTTEGIVQIVVQWPYSASVWFGDKSKVNWMIRVVGTAMLPPD